MYSRVVRRSPLPIGGCRSYSNVSAPPNGGTGWIEHYGCSPVGAASFTFGVDVVAQRDERAEQCLLPGWRVENLPPLCRVVEDALLNR